METTATDIKKQIEKIRKEVKKLEQAMAFYPKWKSQGSFTTDTVVYVQARLSDIVAGLNGLEMSI